MVDFTMRGMLVLSVVLAGVCLTTEACNLEETAKCLGKAAKDALFLLPKFIKKPGPACEKKNDISKTLQTCLSVHFGDCAPLGEEEMQSPLQETVQNLTARANSSIKAVEAACDNSGCKDVVKKFAHIKKCYNDTGLKAIFHSDTVFDLLNTNNTNTSDTKLCQSAKSFEACLEEESKNCPYLKKKFLGHVQDQAIANEAFAKCGIEITSKAVIQAAAALLTIGLAAVVTLLQI